MGSKKLNTSPFGTVVSDADTQLMEESFLQVEDTAHEVEQSDSFLQEEKTLAEKELETKQKMGREVSGQTDLEEEREMKRVQVDRSLEEFEKTKAKVKQKRLNQNLKSVEQASSDQLSRMRAIQADYIAKAGNQMDVSDGHQIGLAKQHMSEQQAVMNQANSLSNLISMSINDAMMNHGKDRRYAEDYVGEKTGFFGPKNGRQKTIVVNGAMVTLDEDVAEAIQSKRAPLLAGGSKKLSWKTKDITGDTAEEIEANADKVLSDIDAQADVASGDVTDIQAEKAVAVSDVETVAASEKTELDDTQNDKMVMAGLGSAIAANEVEDRYIKSRFAQFERNMAADRRDMENALISYKSSYVVPKYQYGHQLQSEDEQMMDKRPHRDLPAVTWNQVYDDEYMKNGRKLPYIDYQRDQQMQYSM